MTDLNPNSGVNVLAEIEVKASNFGAPAIIGEVDRLAKGLASDIRAGKVKPGPNVQFVQALVFVNSPDDPHEKLGSLRFPLKQFVESGGSLDAADHVEFREYGAGRRYCADEARKASNFCIQVAADPT